MCTRFAVETINQDTTKSTMLQFAASTRSLTKITISAIYLSLFTKKFTYTNNNDNNNQLIAPVSADGVISTSVGVRVCVT